MPPNDPLAYADQFLSRFGPYRLQPYGGAESYGAAGGPPVGFSPVPFPGQGAGPAPATGLPAGSAGLPGQIDPGGNRVGDRTPNNAPDWQGGLGDWLTTAGMGALVPLGGPLGLAGFLAGLTNFTPGQTAMPNLGTAIFGAPGNPSPTGGVGVTPGPLAPGMAFANPSTPGLATPGTQAPAGKVQVPGIGMTDPDIAALVAAGQLSYGNARTMQAARNGTGGGGAGGGGIGGKYSTVDPRNVGPGGKLAGPV